ADLQQPVCHGRRNLPVRPSGGPLTMRRGPSPTRMLWSEMNDGKANERNAYESIISGTSFVLPLNSFGPQYQHGCDCFRRPASLPTYEDLPGAARGGPPG